MKHRNCGGKMVKTETLDDRSVYQCNRCHTVITVYKKTATGGNPNGADNDR